MSISVSPGGQSMKITSETMEQLLRSELEEGNITFHDFERTKRFASVNRSYWPSATGGATAGLMVYYGRFFRKRPWPMFSLLLFTPVAYAVGTLPGLIAQITAFQNFQRDLDDANGLLQALSKKVRMGTVEHSSAPQDSERRDAFSQAMEDSQTGQQGNERMDRWAELRKASATASNSTWDRIRQTHEKASGMQTAEGRRAPEAKEADDREAEQAKFDALLEEERKMSS